MTDPSVIEELADLASKFQGRPEHRRVIMRAITEMQPHRTLAEQLLGENDTLRTQLAYAEDAMKGLTAEVDRLQGEVMVAARVRPRQEENDALKAEVARLRTLLGELYDGDACSCEGGPEHDNGCLQIEIEAALR